MSTVTTRLCQYGHRECYKHMSQTQVVLVPTRPKGRPQKAAGEAHRDRVLAKLQALLEDGVEPRQVVTLLGYSKPSNLRKALHRWERADLALLFAKPRGGRQRPKPGTPRCALADCEDHAVWVEDDGLDPDDEPIAHWAYLCRVHQAVEDLCEDLEFLLDPKRGRESHPYRILPRLGYQGTHVGLESLRRRLERWGRIDLRDAMNLDALEVQREWPHQGTVRPGPGRHAYVGVAAKAEYSWRDMSAVQRYGFAR